METSSKITGIQQQEWLALVERISNSRFFAKSPRLRDFLLYVAHQSLHGRVSEINEIEIAREVFNRGVGFVPTEDSVVRSAARQLRLKIKEYFDEEGHTERWRLEIPKGSYVPVFRPYRPQTQSPRWQNALRLSLAANAILAATSLILGWNVAQPVSSQSPSVASAFLRSSNGPVQLIISDFSQAIMRYMSGRNLSLDEYVRLDYSSQEPPEVRGDLRRLFELLRTHHLTRSGDVAVAVRFVQAERWPGQISIRQARDVAARDVRSSNLILLGNPNSTPWIGLFEGKLDFEWVSSRGYRDRKTGKEYFQQGSSFHERGTSFARLALVRNFDGSGRVLIVSGINMVTMEAAGEYAASVTGWRELCAALKHSMSDPPPLFEALLQTDAMENTPVHAKLLAARVRVD